MSITSYCSECEAQTVNGVLAHLEGCSANNFRWTTEIDYFRPPAVELRFDTPEEQAEWMEKMRGGFGGSESAASIAPYISTPPSPNTAAGGDELVLRRPFSGIARLPQEMQDIIGDEIHAAVEAARQADRNALVEALKSLERVPVKGDYYNQALVDARGVVRDYYDKDAA